MPAGRKRQGLQLDCTKCNSFENFYHELGSPNTVVRCDECDKKHSTASVHFVNLRRSYERDENGELVEDVL